LGGKINGSGGGGCMVAYPPKHAEIVDAAIEKVGGKSLIISSDSGTRIV
jgi:galactokinase